MLRRQDEVEEIAYDMYRVMVDGSYTGANGGPAQAVGLEFRVLHNGGRLETEYQFGDKRTMKRIENEILSEVVKLIVDKIAEV